MQPMIYAIALHCVHVEILFEESKPLNLFQEPCGSKEDNSVVGGHQRRPTGSQPIFEVLTTRQLRRQRVSSAGGFRGN